MRIGNRMRVIAVASLVVAGAAAPAWAHGGSATLQNGDTATTLQNSDSSARGTLQYGDTATTLQNGDSVTIQNGDTATTLQRDDNGTLQTWSEDTAAQSGGIIREDAFLDEMGRRWDADPNHTGSRNLYLQGMRARWEAIDPDNQGLTPAQVSELTGSVDSSAGPTLSGSGAQPGNMGPGNVKGQ